MFKVRGVSPKHMIPNVEEGSEIAIIRRMMPIMESGLILERDQIEGTP